MRRAGGEGAQRAATAAARKEFLSPYHGAERDRLERIVRRGPNKGITGLALFAVQLGPDAWRHYNRTHIGTVLEARTTAVVRQKRHQLYSLLAAGLAPRPANVHGSDKKTKSIVVVLGQHAAVRGGARGRRLWSPWRLARAFLQLPHVLLLDDFDEFRTSSVCPFCGTSKFESYSWRSTELATSLAADSNSKRAHVCRNRGCTSRGRPIMHDEVGARNIARAAATSIRSVARCGFVLRPHNLARWEGEDESSHAQRGGPFIIPLY